MRKFLLLVPAIFLIACGPAASADKLSADEQKALALETEVLKNSGFTVSNQAPVIGRVASDAQGNRAVYVDVRVSADGRSYNAPVLMIFNKKGEFIAADVMIPSSDYGVQGPGASASQA